MSNLVCIATILKAEIQKAVAARNFDPKVIIGFDPTHIEMDGVTIAGASGADTMIGAGAGQGCRLE